MTTRDHYNQIKDSLEDSEFAETLCNVYESKDITEAKLLVSKIYNELQEEVNKDRGTQDFYEGKREEQLNEYKAIYNDMLKEESLEEIKGLATYFYDALCIEKIRTYAYNVYLKGGINHYNQLASDMQDCYLDSLKEEGLYDEWKGSKYADIDCSIGDGLKLGE